MADVIPFRKKDNALKNDERLIQYLKDLIAAKAVGDTIHEVTGEVLCVTAQLLNQPYDELRDELLNEDGVMTAPALSSMICLTSGIFRDEVEAIARFEVQLWDTFPVTEYFVTAHRGGFAYHFRTTDNLIAHLAFQLTAYDTDSEG